MGTVVRPPRLGDPSALAIKGRLAADGAGGDGARTRWAGADRARPRGPCARPRPRSGEPGESVDVARVASYVVDEESVHHVIPPLIPRPTTAEACGHCLVPANGDRHRSMGRGIDDAIGSLVDAGTAIGQPEMWYAHHRDGVHLVACGRSNATCIENYVRRR